MQDNSIATCCSMGIHSSSSTVKIPKGFVFIPEGSFLMGSSPDQLNCATGEEPQHLVRIRSFAMSKYQVTQGEWKDIMGYNRSFFSGLKHPVESVSWYETLVYCNKRSLAEKLTPCYRISGSLDPVHWGEIPMENSVAWNMASCNFYANGYRLPTEAEWEYACRSGTTTATSFGDSLISLYANFDGRRPYNAVTQGPCHNKTSSVGSYQANAWGLYDMHGNVWEWCWDWFNDYTPEKQENPSGSPLGTQRVLRGGSWLDYGQSLRSAYRNLDYPDNIENTIGLRLAQSLEVQE